MSADESIIAAVIQELDRFCPDAVVIFVSNPVDVLTCIAVETSTRPAHRILGCGTVLDGARLRHQLGMIVDVDKESVHAYAIGQHGDAPFLSGRALRWARSGSRSIGFPGRLIGRDRARARCRNPPAGREHPRASGLQELPRGGRHLSAGARGHQGRQRIFMLSVLAAAEHGIGPVVLSLPGVIGAARVDRQLLLTTSREEQRMLERSGALLEAAYQSLPTPPSQPDPASQPEPRG